jgi:hypothetical protein
MVVEVLIVVGSVVLVGAVLAGIATFSLRGRISTSGNFEPKPEPRGFEVLPPEPREDGK